MRVTWLVRLYPRAWRRRYGEEFIALLGERPLTLSTVWDVLRGALDTHWAPQFVEEEQVMRSTTRRLVALIAGLLVLSGYLIALRWIMSQVRHFADTFGVATVRLARIGTPELVIIMVVTLAALTVPARRWDRARRVALVELLGVAALVTPTPDPINLVFAFVPLYLLFEIMRFLVYFARPRQPASA